MLVESNKMIAVTRLQKELTQRLRELSETGEPLYVLRNNEMTAVILSAEEYDLLKQSEDILEQIEIADTIERRLKSYDHSKNIPWDVIKKRHGH
ncbi:MAG: type II toxin-antitoxin system Phd/YefM family antitoxin [Nitrospirae bacterium]|nr:type II toxin-antitoxin system Phd/YefM family antitoxin [Nitrospirota bacterium]